MTAAAQHGSKSVLKYNAVDLTSYLQSDYDSEQSVDQDDTTPYGASSESHLDSPIKKNKALQFSGIWDATVHAALSGIVGTQHTLQFFPMGTTTGNALQTGNASLSAYGVKTSKGGKVEFTATITPSGDFNWTAAP